MKQILLIGFSTTGKSGLIKRISNNFTHRIKFDTDKVIAKDFGCSIANIYYSYEIIEDAYKRIDELENAVLNHLTTADNNLIIAAGPGIPFKDFFPNYISAKNPHVILLERPASEIYESLITRRNEMKSKPEHQRPDFGIWDLGIMVKKINGELVDLPREEAIQNINTALTQRQEFYTKYTTLKINSTDIFGDKQLPQNLLDII